MNWCPQVLNRYEGWIDLEDLAAPDLNKAELNVTTWRQIHGISSSRLTRLIQKPEGWFPPPSENIYNFVPKGM